MTDETPVPAPSDETVAIAADAAEADDAVAGKPAAPRRRLTPLTIGLIAAAGVLVIALVAVLVVTLGGKPSVAETAQEPSPSVTTPTAEPIVVPAPTPRIDVPCASLVSAPTLSLVTSVPLRLVSDGNGTPDGTWEAAQRQLGGLHCVWGGGTGRTGGGWDDGVTIDVRPDAEAAYRARLESDWVWSAYYVVDSVGDDSIYRCSTWEGSYSCSGELLSGKTWSTVTLSGASSGTIEQEVAEARFVAVMTSVDAAVRSAGPYRPVWSAPDAVMDPRWFCSDPGASAVASSAWNLGPLVPPSDNYPDESFAAAGGVSCGWFGSGGQTSVWVSLLRGGAWSLDTYESDPPDIYPYSAFSSVEVEGADRAYVGCGDGCLLTMSIEGSRVDVTLPIMEPDDIVAGAPALVRALLQH